MFGGLVVWCLVIPFLKVSKGIKRYYIFNKKYNLNISLYITYNEIPFCHSV